MVDRRSPEHRRLQPALVEEAGRELVDPRFQDLRARIETEGWATACVDYLETRSDADADWIGPAGWSLGGYYCPRAAAFEKRIRFFAVWGANHNWVEVQRKRLQREGENPVPPYWEHALWVWGFDDVEKFIAYAEGIHLDGVVEQITVPFPIAHGANDRQIWVDHAHRSYDRSVNRQKRELLVFTVDEGAAEYVGLDHMPHINAFVADLGSGHPGRARRVSGVDAAQVIRCPRRETTAAAPHR